MSAPLKIWVPVPVTDEGPCYVDKDEAEIQWGCTAVAYHHDDVVRELQLAAWEVNRLLNITHGRDLSWRQMLDGANGR